MSELTLSPTNIEIKIAELTRKISDCEKEIIKDREMLLHLEFVRDNFNSILPDVPKIIDPINPTLFPTFDYSSDRTVKQLVLDILRNEHRALEAKEIYDILHTYKPEVKQSSMRVAISVMKKTGKYQIELIKHNGKYLYQLGTLK